MVKEAVAGSDNHTTQSKIPLKGFSEKDREYQKPCDSFKTRY